MRAWSVGVGGSGLFTAVLPGTGGRGLELCLKTATKIVHPHNTLTLIAKKYLVALPVS